MNNEDQTSPQTNGASQNGASPSGQTDAEIPAVAPNVSNGLPDLATLQNELENTRLRLNELTQISQQALADLQNFKKRTEEEKIKFVAFANAALISELLPVVDDLERAMEHLPLEPAGREWANGIAIVLKKMQDVLAAHGLEQIQTGQQPFDPSLHEAMLTEAGEPDQIIRELAKGYRIGERVLRRSKVVVGQTAAPTTPAEKPAEPSPAPSDSAQPQ